MSRIRLLTFDKNKKRSVKAGYVENGVFYKNVDNEHYMIKYSGYGVQVDVLEELVKAGIKEIRIITSKGTLIKSHLSDWVSKGKKDSFGHGEQIFLAVSEMSK